MSRLPTGGWWSWARAAIAWWVPAADLFFGALGASLHDEWLDREDFRPHPGWVMLAQGTQTTVKLSH
jgi:hypothetical protein